MHRAALQSSHCSRDWGLQACQGSLNPHATLWLRPGFEGADLRWHQGVNTVVYQCRQFHAVLAHALGLPNEQESRTDCRAVSSSRQPVWKTRTCVTSRMVHAADAGILQLLNVLPHLQALAGSGRSDVLQACRRGVARPESNTWVCSGGTAACSTLSHLQQGPSQISYRRWPNCLSQLPSCPSQRGPERRQGTGAQHPCAPLKPVFGSLLRSCRACAMRR